MPEELPATRTALVQEIWKTLNNLSVAMDVSHYNALLRVYLENEHEFSPTDFLADLQTKGIEPNRVTFQRLISRYCQLGDIDGATRILEFMREKQLPINEHVFNALIMGHSQAEDLESSLGIIAVMRQAGLEPTSDTYTTLLCSYAKVGNIEAIQRQLDECEQKELYLLDKDIFDVIYTLATNGHGQHVAALLPRLRKSAGYNQDAVNLILRLTNRGQERIAFEVLKTMPRGSRSDGELTDTGSFFVKQMVKVGCAEASVVGLCQELQDSGMNGRAFVVAIEAAVTGGSVELSLPLLRRLRDQGQPIRQHYFWPLICAQGKRAGADGVLSVLRQIRDEFGVVLNGETVRDYVVPQVAERNGEKLVALLRSAGVSVSTATTSVVHHLLAGDRLRDAAQLAASYNVYYQPGLYRRPLVQALVATGDVKSFVDFVRQLYDNMPRLKEMRQKATGATTAETADGGAELVDEAEQDASGDVIDPQLLEQQSEVLGQIIVDVCNSVRKNRVQVVTELLQALVAQGLSISNGQAERIQERLGSELNADISEALGRLAAGDLEPIALERSQARGSGFSQLSVEQLERMIEQQDGRGENSKGLKRFLLSALFKAKDLAKLEPTLERLQKEGFVLTTGIYAQLIELLCHHEQTDKAMEQFRQMRSREPDFQLDDYKVIRLVGLLVKDGRLDDALALVEENRRGDRSGETEPHTFSYNTTCWRILNGLAEAGKADELQRLFDQLQACGFVEPSNALLGPLVKVHLVRGDAQRAVDVFEELSVKHQCTPWKNDLACKLIQAEDATNLQRVTDLSTNIHGEVNSLYDLVFSFVECGRIRQARKILETPGLRSRPQKINVACERYQQEGMVQPLEGLVEATKDLNHIDRGDIYYNLLLSYCKDKQPEKALGLWTKMQEEDIQPSDEFLTKLGNFLRGNGLEVPFVMPETSRRQQQPQQQQQQSRPQQKTDAKKAVVENVVKVAAAAASQPKKTKPTKAPAVAAVAEEEPKSETLATFKRSLRASNSLTADIDATIQAKHNLLATDQLTITDQSLYIEACLNGDRNDEANRTLLDMLANRKQFPLPRIFRYHLNKVAAAGDVAVLHQIGDLIEPETKRLVSFDNRLCHAYVEAGKTEEYLRGLNDQMNAAKTDDERQAVADKFPRGGAIGILEKHPELSAQCECSTSYYSTKCK